MPATNTPNFNLIKPGEDDFYNVNDQNVNMDTIDGVLKTLQDAINSGATEQELAEIRQELATHLADEVKHITAAERTSWNGKMGASEKGAANGVATLGADKKIPIGQFPDLSSLGFSKITIGSYIGDRTSGRFIDIGFTPKVVLLTCISSASRPYMQITASGTYGVASGSNSNQHTSADTVTSNGFLVSYRAGDWNGGSNSDGATYEWVAFS